MTLVVTSAFKELYITKMMSVLQKVVTLRTRELQKYVFVKETVGALSEHSRPRQQPLVVEDRHVSREDPQPRWEWAKLEKEKRD